MTCFFFITATETDTETDGEWYKANVQQIWLKVFQQLRYQQFAIKVINIWHMSIISFATPIGVRIINIDKLRKILHKMKTTTGEYGAINAIANNTILETLKQ